MPSSPFETPIAPLLQTVFTAILEVFLLCLAGYILASRGILDKKTQKQLNRLNVSLFTPSLLFSKVAFFLTPAKLRELWIIPIFFVLVTALSMTVSFFLGWICQLSRSQRNFAMAAAMFMNSNSLPIALIQSLVVTVPGLKWGEDDNKNAMLGRALTYLVMYSTLGMMLRWSYGVRLLASADVESNGHEPDPNIIIPSAEPHFSAAERIIPYVLDGPVGGESSGDEDAHTVVGRSGGLRLQPSSGLNRFYYSFPNSPNPRRSGPGRFSPTPNTSDSEMPSDDELPSGNPPPRHQYREPTSPTSTRLQSFFRQWRYRLLRLWRTVNDFMTAPLWAALASLLVACIRPVQHALEDHMQAVKGALSNAGNCSIPVTLVVLGAYFYEPPRSPAARADGSTNGTMIRNSSSSLILNVKKLLLHVRDGNETHGSEVQRPGETRTVIVALVSRMLITPLLLLPMMALSTKLNLQPVFEDPVFLIANVLLISSPPALTLAQITQTASGDAFERLISRTIFWSYCVVTPPTIIIYVVIGLLLTKLQ